jgi:formylmethanofuran dehydrogenase subunit E
MQMIQDLWDKAVEFHGHVCPGLAIGVRACDYIMQHPDFAGTEYGALYCVVESDACGVDAIQRILGCSIGKGNLVCLDIGKHAYSFFNKKNGKGLRAYLKGNKTENMTNVDWQKHILFAPLEEIFTFSAPPMPCPAPAQKFDTILCEICGEGSSERKIQLQNGKKVCQSCFKPYKRGW